MQEKNIHITKSYKETQKLGENMAKKILKMPLQKTAVILGLKGNLGGGKTTFLQGFAKGLGVKEKVLSPTFVIIKKYKLYIKRPVGHFVCKQQFFDFYHIDCYRLKNEKDILELNFKEIISDPKNIIAVEWPEKIKKVLSKNIIKIDFKFVDKNKREIRFDRGFGKNIMEL